MGGRIAPSAPAATTLLTAPVSLCVPYITGLGADGASAGVRSAASGSGERWWSTQGERWWSTQGERWSSTQDAASRSSWAAARACSDVSIDPCSASTHTTTSPSSFCTVAMSTEEPSSVRTVDQRGPSWPPGSRSQSACLVWHQLGHESRLKRSSAMVMVPVYPVLPRPADEWRKCDPIVKLAAF
jgi:hypothetical protein